MPHSSSLFFTKVVNNKSDSVLDLPLLVIRNASTYRSFAVHVHNTRTIYAASAPPSSAFRLEPGGVCAIATLKPMEFEGGAYFTGVYIQSLDVVESLDLALPNVNEIMPFAAVANPMESEPSLDLLYCGRPTLSGVSMLHESATQLRGFSPFRHIVNYAIAAFPQRKCARGNHMSERFLLWYAGGVRWSDTNDAYSSSSIASYASSNSSLDSTEMHLSNAQAADSTES